MNVQSPSDALYAVATAYSLSRCLHVVADLGVADMLGDSGRAITEVAEAVDADTDALSRVLRLLASHEIFFIENGALSHTPQSQLLRSDHPQSQRNLVRLVGSVSDWEVFEHLGHTVRTGRPAHELMQRGKAWEAQSDPEADAIFNAAMAEYYRELIPGIARSYDYQAYPVIGDIGGGWGHVLRAVLNMAPDSIGILFDREHVVGSVPLLASDRITTVAGNFFSDSVPACDLYLIKDTIHDWPDAESIQILRNVRASAGPQSRLLLIETIVPENNERHVSKEMDVRMMIFFGARQRTAAEFESLLNQSGFQLERVIDTGAGISIIEATPA